MKLTPVHQVKYVDQTLTVIRNTNSMCLMSPKEKRAKRWQEEYEWKRSFFEIDYTFGINAFDLDKCTDVMKDKVFQEHVFEEEVPLNNSIGKKGHDFVTQPSEGMEQVDGFLMCLMRVNGGLKGTVPTTFVKKGNLEFLVCKEIANPGVNELVDKGRPLKRKRVYAE
ncbi:hypothetical protein Tco_1266406 [Tanacetum coccineum]